MSALPSHHPKYRTKLCRNFANGNCPYGQKCNFFHPTSGAKPPLASLAQRLFDWNALLPQLLALSGQQGAPEKMPHWSPPRSQGPQLVDEDPSPSTSLLLSRSDSTSSEQTPEKKRSSRRKKYPCRHFIRTGGWCPAGAQCRFYHDVAALPFAGTRDVKPFEIDAYREEGRTISGGVLMSMQLPPPPANRPEHLDPLWWAGAQSTQPYQPLYWPNCAWQTYQPNYSSIPAAAAVSISATAAPGSVMHHSIHSPPQTQAQPVPQTETQTSLPLGTYEVNGTTYFPTSRSSVPAPVPATYTVPVQSASYGHPTAPAYPYYAPPALPASYCKIPNQTTVVRPQCSFDPFASDLVTTDELPVIPRLEDYQISPIRDEVPPFPFLLPSPSAPTSEVAPMATRDQPTAPKDSDHEFPYRPPKNQRVGHARRISVNIKKQTRASSG